MDEDVDQPGFGDPKQHAHVEDDRGDRTNTQGSVLAAAPMRDLRDRTRPGVVARGHCTGRAKGAVAAAYAPGRYRPSVVGSLYALAG